MISIQVSHSVSERLSAYCFGRVLAARFGYAFAFPQLRNLILDWRTDGAHLIGDHILWRGQWPFDLQSGRMLSKGELRIPPGRRLVLAGGFHRFDLFSEEREKIRGQWLVPAHSFPVRNQREFAICLAPLVFLPDGTESIGEDCLTEVEIRELVRTVKHSELTLITDRQNHPLLSALVDLSFKVAVCEGWTQMLLVQSFQKIAISQDPTQWWGAFLGNATEIYFPRVDRGQWSHSSPAILAHDPWWHGIDLQVPDDTRYIYNW